MHRTRDTHGMSAARTPGTRWLRASAFLPVVLLVLWGILSAAGIRTTSDARAASTNATANISVGLIIDLTTDCSATFNGGSFSVGDNLIGSCNAAFSSNGTVGTTLTVHNGRTSGNAFCNDGVGMTSNCVGPSFTNATGTGSLAGGAFGVRVASAPTCNDPGSPWANGNYYGVPNIGSPATVCSTVAPASGAYSLEFHANRAAGTTAATYQGEVNLNVTAS